jgi:hypothetical protein
MVTYFLAVVINPNSIPLVALFFEGLGGLNFISVTCISCILAAATVLLIKSIIWMGHKP